MLYTVARLIADLFRVTHRLLWSLAAMFGSRAVLILIGVLGAILFASGARDGSPVWAIVFPLMFVNYALHQIAKNIVPGPWPERRRPLRAAKARPVPVVQTLTKTADAPTVRQTLARLSPTLRRVIEEPPPALGD